MLSIGKRSFRPLPLLLFAAILLCASQTFATSVSGPTDVCPNTSVQYSVNLPSNAITNSNDAPPPTYLWSTGSATVLSSVFDASVSVSFSSGIYTTSIGCWVSYYTPDGGDDDTDPDYHSENVFLDNIHVNGVSSVGSISGTTVLPFCTDATQTFSIDDVQGAVSFTWSLPLGSSGSSSGTSIDVFFPAASAGGNICVHANGCGSEHSQNVCINVTRSAPPPPVFGGKSPTCVCLMNTQKAKYCVTPGYDFYDWVVPTGWTYSVDPNFPNCITVAFNGVAASQAQIKCRGALSCNGGPAVLSDWSVINVSTMDVTPTPPNPNITIANTVNEAKKDVNIYIAAPPPCVTATWSVTLYEFGAAVNGKEGTGGGYYHIIMHNGESFIYGIDWVGPCGDKRWTGAGYTLDHGQLKVMELQRTSQSGIENGADGLKLYPNPASDRLTLVSDGISGDNVRVQVVGIDGRVLMSRAMNLTGSGDNVELDIADLPNGVYNLTLTNGPAYVNKRFVVQK